MNESSNLIDRQAYSDRTGITSSHVQHHRGVMRMLMNIKSHIVASALILFLTVSVFHIVHPYHNQKKTYSAMSDSVFANEDSDANQDLLLSLKSPKQQSYNCHSDPNYSIHTAKTAYELPFAALFADTRSQTKFEASSITKFEGNYYAICDNSWAISKFSPSLTPFSEDNIMIGDPRREEEDSGYEAIFFRDQVAYVVRESVEHNHATNTTYHAIIEELSITGDDYTILDQCRSEFTFEGNSKGFEGAFGLNGSDGDYYILGLCEGNHCSEQKDLKFDKGNGRIIVMRKSSAIEDKDGEACIWITHSIIQVPKSAAFRDYSDISITPSGKVAITTQEDSALWIGQLLGVQDGVFDPETAKFDDNIGQVYQFPKSDSCETVYCNIEGITFMNDNMVMAVSDQMKKKGKQDFYCLEKDQSIHAFVLP